MSKLIKIVCAGLMSAAMFGAPAIAAPDGPGHGAGKAVGGGGKAGGSGARTAPSGGGGGNAPRNFSRAPRDNGVAISRNRNVVRDRTVIRERVVRDRPAVERRHRDGDGDGGRRHRGTRYLWGGLPFYFYDGFYHGDCGWLRRRAEATGSRYWWIRYRQCREDD